MQHLSKNWKYFNRLNPDYLDFVFLTYISMATFKQKRERVKKKLHCCCCCWIQKLFFQIKNPLHRLQKMLVNRDFVSHKTRTKFQSIQNQYSNSPLKLWLTKPCYSIVLFILKMESVSKYTIFGLKVMVKSGLEKLFWNPSMWEDSYIYYRIFLDHFSPSFLGQKLYFWIQIPFWG